MKIRLSMLLASFGMATVAHAQGIHAVRKLDGYQCMSLAHVWNGEGPQPAPVIAYVAPTPGAPRAGFIAATAIVASPPRVESGKLSVLWPNGRTVWADQQEFVPFRVASDPHAVCTPVLLSNGRFGTTGRQ